MNLKELIDSEPANAGRTDQEVVDWLNESVTAWQDVPWLELTVWLHEQGITRTALNTAAAGSGATATAAQHIIDVVTAGQNLSASDSRVRALINASSLGATAKAALVAIAQVSEPRWVETEVDWERYAPDVTENDRRLADVARARAS